ncbi:ATP-binding protein [uncultured Zoogloea sp.]|uniref:ATP-binding protein n=1 Tax=uncultured Zoogloea sp. TaxID=160237 RepID=UPI00262A6B06|nr:ATP-binding protein [uncultured Zoogloea sp.]
MASRIWLVGDNPQLAGQIEAWLAPAGYACRSLACLEACVRLTDELTLGDRVIVDVSSDECSLALLAVLKDAGVQVTLLLEAEDLLAVETGLYATVSGFLVKPFERQALVAALALPWGGVSAPAGGYFPFRTLEDVTGLSQLVAGLCPESEMVQIALSELMLNAVEHGNLGLGFVRKGELMSCGAWRNEVERLLDTPAYLERFAYLRVELRPREVRFLIRDQGNGFDPEPYLNLNPARSVEPHGRGIAIARMLAFPDLVFLEGGRCVEGVVRRLAALDLAA